MVRLTQGPGKSERSDALANRQRILEAARDLFARRGLDAEIREIAERAGVGIGTLYRHFDSRDGLLAALKQEAKEDMLRRLQAVVETQEPATALRAMIRVGAEACQQFGALAEAILSSRLDALDSGEVEMTELLADLLRRGMEKGVFRSDLDVPVALAALKSVFTSGAFIELAGQRSFAAAADAVADFFLAAIEGPRRRQPA